MIDLTAHETPPEAVGAAEVITGHDAVIDALYRYLFSGCHVDLSIGSAFSIPPADFLSP